MTSIFKRHKRALRAGTVLLLIGGLTACAGLPSQSDKRVETEKPRNIILMIGDGMGFAYLKAHRQFTDNPDTPEIDSTLFDQLLTGAVKTDNDDATYKVTDSAASATAYATGYKTLNDAISVDKHGQTVETALEVASKHQRSTGLVATSHINHATPAAFIAHVPKRKQYKDIANSFFDNQVDGEPQVDVILGGGTHYFRRDDRDLVAEFEQAGYQFLENSSDLKSASGDKLLGLFAPKAMPAMWEREAGMPSLADMTEVALNTLSRDKNGFFLMVEGSQIDWGGHENDVLYALSEMEDFEAAVATALEFVEKNPDTLLVITADHETGGLSIGADDIYDWDVDLLRKIHATSQSLAAIIKSSDEPLKKLEELTSIEANDEEQAALLAAMDKPRALKLAISGIVSRATHTGWTTGKHTAVDVPLMATGAGSEHFKGLMDNTEIGKAMIELNKQ